MRNVMKKLAVLLSVLLCVCMIFAACGKKNSGSGLKFKEIAVEGYSEPFSAKLTTYMEKMLASYVSDEERANSTGIPNYGIYWYEEWTGLAAPDKELLKDGEIPVMCAAHIDPNGNSKIDEKSLKDLAFYFTYKPETHKYTLLFAASYGDDDVTVHTEDYSKELVDQIYKADQTIFPKK